jgi:trk system potassium uptake protein TrkH
MLFDVRPIFLVLGGLLTTLGGAMVLPALIDFSLQNNDWQIFALTGAFTLFIGVGLAFANWGQGQSLSIQQAFILTTAVWVVVPAFAALPFVFGELRLSFTDGYFEAMSGLSTTGSTVISGLETVPPGLLMWRALLQWMGGIGIIVMAVAILPMLQVGGMQLFRMDASDDSDKILPRAAQVAGNITYIYLAFSLACVIAYWAAGMSMFDAVAHAMTTIATGGFSTFDNSVGHFDSAAIDYISVVFMILGSLPFVLYLQAVRGDAKPLMKDSQVRTFFLIAAACVVTMIVYQWVNSVHVGWDALRFALFNVVSVMTGTGYATTDYGSWGSFSVTFFFFLMFVGGCAGSTSCGVKIFRIQVLFGTLDSQIRKMISPHGIFHQLYNGKRISQSAVSSVMSFFSLFMALFALLAILLSALGLDTVTAISGAATALANVGPGLGDIIGPSGNFAPLPTAAKWLLSTGMLLGRLELFTVLILFLPAFWRA